MTTLICVALLTISALEFDCLDMLWLESRIAIPHPAPHNYKCRYLAKDIFQHDCLASL